MQRRWKGFTLIELLVVIAIIAILAAILFPVFSEAKKRSQMVGCLNNLKQLGVAFRQYTDDNDGRMPRVGSAQLHPYTRLPNWCGAYLKKNPSDPTWCYPDEGQIFPYTRNVGLYFCKTDKGRKSENIKYAPVGLKPADYPLSYSMNYYLDAKVPESAGFRLISKCFLLLHEDRTQINDGILIPSNNPSRDIPDDVHYEGTTILYVDGHARYAKQKVLLQECKDGYWKPPGT